MEKNILIINLKRFGDIYLSTQIIDSIVATDSLINVEILVYSEFSKVVKTIQNISRTHTIDREKVISFKNNPVYSDAFSINELFKSLEPLKKKKWDKIINYSNDHVSTYIASYLASDDNCLGVSFNEKNIIKYSSRWAIVFIDLLTTYKHTPINFTDCLHNLVGVKKSVGVNHIITSEKHNSTAFENIERIRKKETLVEKTGKNKGKKSSLKIIGIQLTSSQENKNIPFETMVSLIGMLLDDPNKYPVLLIAPNEEERRYVNRINEYFDNKLITIESDFIALSSVLANIDLLITPDTVVKHLADLLKTPLVEVSLGSGPFLKQGSNNPGSFILTDTVENRSWFSGGPTMKTAILAEDIFNAVSIYFNPTLESALKFSSNVTLYRVILDSQGTTYYPICGEVDASLESLRLMSRYVLFSLMESKNLVDIEEMVVSQPTESIKDLVKYSREHIVVVTKLILNTLRCLLKTKDGAKHGQAFLDTLNELLAECDSQKLVAIPIIFFRAKLEALTSTTVEQNITDVESLLYELKSNIQLVILMLNMFETKAIEQFKRNKEREEKEETEQEIN